MNDYIILADSTSDLPLEIVKKFCVEVLPMKITIDGKNYNDNEINLDDFYKKIKNRVSTSTSQINPGEFEDYFEKYLQDGKDILYVCFSSGLSGTYNSACIAAKSLMQKYTDRKIIVVDSLSAACGETILIDMLIKKKLSGYSIEEVEDFANDIKMKICHWAVVDDLYHLQRGGRIGKTVAIVGSMMNIKPIIKMNDDGKLVLFGKSRGRQKAIDVIVSKLTEFGTNLESQTIYICHTGCKEEAEKLSERLFNELNIKNTVIVPIGATISSHLGTGALALMFLGENR